MVNNHFKLYITALCEINSPSEMKTDETFSTAQQFYKDLGDIAVEKGYAWILLLYVYCW